MTFEVPKGKMLKPFYNSRQGARLQNTARELNEARDQLFAKQEESAVSNLKVLQESTFTRVKSRSVQRREKNLQHKQNFNESLVYMLSKVAYDAMPVDNKEAVRIVNEDGKEVFSPSFMSMANSMQTVVNKDPNVSMIIGELYSRTSVTNIGGTHTMSAGQLATSLAATFNPFNVKNSDAPTAVNLTPQNYIDILTSFGDISSGQEKQTGNINEALYDELILKTTEKVEKNVLAVLKEETDKIDLQSFLEENTKDDIYASHSNRNLTRNVSKPTVFREIFKTVTALSESAEYRQEHLMSEAIAQYTVMETLNTLGLLNKNPEQVMRECLEARRVKRLGK
jgi:hypothetical protein